jgi:hypothetical protein
MTTMKRFVACFCVCAALVLSGCSGDSPTAPSAPTQTPTPTPPPVVNPTVTIQMTYNCHPCNNDRDNYSLNIDCGSKGCLAFARPSNPLLEHNTIAWTGQLAPGKHTVETVVRVVEQPMILTFQGGVKPGSLRQTYTSTASLDILAMQPCGLVNTFKSRPGSYGLESVFEFEVAAGTPGC